jgi:hypothetical protein
MSLAEQIQLYSILIRTFIEIGMLDEAQFYADLASEADSRSGDSLASCILYNTLGILKSAQGIADQAHSFYEKAAGLSSSLPPELMLMTLSNIALHLKETSPKEAVNYLTAVRKLSSELNFHQLAEDVL